MSLKLDKLKQKLQGKSEVTINTEVYFLAKELGCLGDLLGREYEVINEKSIWWKPSTWRRIKGFKQKPITIPAFIEMMDEMQKDYHRQEKQMKKGRRGKK